MSRAGTPDIIRRIFPAEGAFTVQQNPSTQELWVQLFQAASPDLYLRDLRDEQDLPPLHEYLRALCEARGEKPERVLKRGDIDSSYGHRILSGQRNPSRDTVLQFAFGLELDAEETQQLLKIARATALHPRVKRDAVIAYCLQHHDSLVDTQQILFTNNMPLIGEKTHGE